MHGTAIGRAAPAPHTHRKLPVRPVAPLCGPALIGSRRVQLARCRNAGLRCRDAGLRRRPTAAAAQPSDSVVAPTAEPPGSTALQAFLGWLLANGVEGVGAADSKVGLFEGQGGERGMVSLQPIAAGEVLLRLGTQLAVTDQSEEHEVDWSGGPGDEEEPPWSVRLAAKLLRMARQGDDCRWREYVRVLPAVVPSPLTTFSWEDVEALEYLPMRRQLDHLSWLAASASASQRLVSASRGEWDWALSVVHSRTFGAPGGADQGGVGVRMLVPLVDMLNHRGDLLTSPPGAAQPRAVACDNVRWDLQPPTEPGAHWAMAVTATRGIEAGEELLLSYGERSNDDFVLHYGFCPPRNPHDDVELFEDIEACIDWWLAAFLPAGALPPQRLQLAIGAAYGAAEQEDGAAAAAEGVLANVPEAEAQVIRAQLASIKLSAGGMVDGRLLAAYRTLYESAVGGAAAAAADLGPDWRHHVRRAVGWRCSELLGGMPTPLLRDLDTLAAWEQQTGQQQHGWAAAQRHYSPAVAAYEAQNGGPAQQQAVGGPAAAGAGATLLDAGAAAADADLARLLLGRAPRSGQQPGDEGEDGSRAQLGSRNGEASILPVQYRCYKKMALWDAVLLSAQ